MKFSKLSHQILIVFVVVAVLSLGIAEWAATSLAQRIVTNNTLQGHQILAQRIAAEITSEMEDVRSLLLFLAESDVIRSMDPAGATKILTDYQTRFPVFTTIYVVELSGEQIARTDLQLLTLPPDEIALIFAPDGQVIAHSRTTELATLPALTDLILKKALVSRSTGISENYVDELGREVVGIHASVEELRWVVVIQTPLAKLEAEVATLRRTMIIGLLAGLALAIIAGWLMSKRLTRPVEQLVWAADELKITNQKLEQELAEHKKTQEALIKVLDNTEILYMTSRSLIAIENLPDLLQNIVDSIARALPANRVILVTVDLETREINHFAKGGPGAAKYVTEISFDELWAGLSGWVLRELKPALSSKEQADPRESPAVQQRRAETNCGAIMVVPLLYRDDIFGTVTAINRPDEANFDQANISVMTSLANQAAVAIENARLYEKTVQSAMELAALYEIEKRIAATLDLDELLQIIARNAVQLIGADNCLIMLVDVQKSELIKVTGYGYSQTELKNHTYKEFFDGISGWVFQNKRPTLSADIKKDPRNQGQALAHARRSKHKSIAVAPLVIGDVVIGTLTVVNGEHKRIFTEDDLDLVTMLAGQAAIAIHNGRLYEAAKQADRLKSAFLATMSHELRTPLNSIIGFTGIMLQGLAGPLNDEQKLQLGMVSKSARHLLDLITDVLDISKIEAGQLKVSVEPVDVPRTIDKAIQTVTPMAEKKGLALSVNIAPEVGRISSDERRLKQIVINLVNNAVKFTEQGEVRLDCELHNDEVVIRVVDTGIGIKPEDMDKLFKPFQQIDIGLTRKHAGTGLGLSICRRLVEMLGGKIWVESEWGRGSVFTFTLPARKPEAEQEVTNEI